jgi:FHS family L-fucose permease-like MFS transporter
LATILAGNVLLNVNEALDPMAIRSAYAASVEAPYLILGSIMIIFALLLNYIPLPDIQTDLSEPLIKDKVPPRKNVLEFPHVAVGCMALFLYVGSEISIFNYLLVKMNTSDTVEVENRISMMIIVFWSGMMVGRFAGAAFLKDISPRKMLIISSLGVSILLLVFMLITSSIIDLDQSDALWILTSIGLFNSVLFPCIFTMAMDGLGKFSEEASSVLIMSLVGGAVIPFIFIEAMSISLTFAFSILLFAYLFIAYFGIKGSRYEKRTNFY